MYLCNLSSNEQRKCQVCCSCHNICVYGETANHSELNNHCEILHFLDLNETSNEVQKIKNGSIKLSNCSSIAVTPGGTNASCHIQLRCLECNTTFHICLLNKEYNRPNKFFCQKQKTCNSSRHKKRSYSAEGSMSSIYAKSIPSSMRLLFERQAIDFDTLGFSIDNEIEDIPEKNYATSDLHILYDDEDQDFDIMFSNTSDRLNIHPEGYSDLGKYMFDNNQFGYLIDA